MKIDRKIDSKIDVQKLLKIGASRDLIWYPKSSLGAPRRAPGGSPRPPEGARTISKKNEFFSSFSGTPKKPKGKQKALFPTCPQRAPNGRQTQKLCIRLEILLVLLYLSISLSIYLSIYLYIYLSLSLSIYIYIYIYIYMYIHTYIYI